MGEMKLDLGRGLGLTGLKWTKSYFVYNLNYSVCLGEKVYSPRKCLGLY